MYSATLNYPVVLTNSTITLSTTLTPSFDHIQPVGSPTLASHSRDPTFSTFSTLAGITVAAQNMFTSKAVQGVIGLIDLSGSLATQYIDDYGTGRYSYYTTQDSCAMNWRDLTVDIVNALNEIMFRTALGASTVSKYAFMNLSDPALRSFYESWPVEIPAGDIGLPGTF